MAAKTQAAITREEFDRRLAQSTQQMHQQALTLEAQATALQDLIGRYASVLERLEAQTKHEIDASSEQRRTLRDLLTELAAQTSAVAATLCFAQKPGALCGPFTRLDVDTAASRNRRLGRR